MLILGITRITYGEVFFGPDLLFVEVLDGVLEQVAIYQSQMSRGCWMVSVLMVLLTVLILFKTLLSTI